MPISERHLSIGLRRQSALAPAARSRIAVIGAFFASASLAAPAFIALVMATGCERARTSSAAVTEAPPPRRSVPPLEECAAAHGLNFTYLSGHAQRYLNPEITGGGVALLDFDDDGDLDVFFLQGGSLASGTGPGDQLFRNEGDRFTNVTSAMGIVPGGYGMGVTAGDFDNDGDPDLYVTRVGADTLLRNDGDRFTDVTATAGVSDPAWSTSAAFVDLDRDGDLDLYVCNYINWRISGELDCRTSFGEPDYCAPAAYLAPARDTFYRNLGDGTFEDATIALGFDQALGNGLGVTFGDFDGDGRFSIFVANDATRNHFWALQPDGRYADVALRRGCAMDEAGRVKAGMGVGNADVDGDGRLDLLVVNLQGETDTFLRGANGFFTDRTAKVRLSLPSRALTRFGAGFVDYDNDGMLDLFEATGRVRRSGAASESADPYAEPNLLCRGDGEGFVEVLPRGGTDPVLVATSRGAAFGDLDNDGGVDIIVVNRDAPAHLLRNVAPARGHWLLLRVLDEHHRDALGATVVARIGDRAIRRDVMAAYSFCSSNDPRVHVGLGSADHVDAVDVTWIDGMRERFTAPVDAVTTLRRGEGAPAPAK